MQDSRIIKFPLMLLGHTPKSILTTKNKGNKIFLPIFTDIAAMTKYNNAFGGKLIPLTVKNKQEIRDVLETIGTISQLDYIVINPAPPRFKLKTMCYTVAEILKYLE